LNKTKKMDAFDFEITTARLPGSTAPGGELIERFGSEAAKHRVRQYLGHCRPGGGHYYCKKKW
jgi:hypothetical protein